MKSRKTKTRNGLGLARSLCSEFLFTARHRAPTLTGYEIGEQCDVILCPDAELESMIENLEARHGLRWDGAKEKRDSDIQATDDWLNGRIATEELQQQLHSGEYREEEWDE